MVRHPSYPGCAPSVFECDSGPAMCSPQTGFDDVITQSSRCHPATIRLPARSSCEWAGSLVCVSRRPSGRLFNGLAPRGGLWAPWRTFRWCAARSLTRERAQSAPKRFALCVPADHSTAAVLPLSGRPLRRVRCPRAWLLVIWPGWCDRRALAPTRGLCWPLGSPQARLRDASAGCAHICTALAVWRGREYAHHGSR